MAFFDFLKGTPAPDMEQLKINQDLENLVLLLNHKNTKTRLEAAKAIREIKTKFNQPPFVLKQDADLGERLLYTSLLVRSLIDSEDVRTETVKTFSTLGGNLEVFKYIFVMGIDDDVYEKWDLPFFNISSTITTPYGTFNEIIFYENSLEALLISGVNVKDFIDDLEKRNIIKDFHRKFIQRYWQRIQGQSNK
jgi:hypothetical protein